MVITIVNLRKPMPKSPRILVDRTTFLGNPFKIDKDTSRTRAIQLYEEWFNEQLTENQEFRDKFDNLLKEYSNCDTIQLACWCYPQLCHATVIKKEMEKYYESKGKS